MGDATPRQLVERDLKAAMLAGDKERVSTLRLLLAELENERIRAGSDVSQETFLGLVQKGIKQRQDSAEQYRGGGRPELAAKEEREAELLRLYLPEPASEEEVRGAVRELIAAESLSGAKGIGRVMQTLVPRFKGRIEGQQLQRIAREELEA
ncbi:MAG TPA: GatB/YqeY domain-containing protein [Thermoanaerobaculia bacterium]|nr:GatB/YqeY domain-containing protein [Thermoanaerobaculia bacterium]